MLSATIVAASTNVGTPIAITGTPIVFWLISFLLFPTPAPGVIPVSLICIVLNSLEISLEISASIAIMQSGLIFSVIPFIISPSFYSCCS